LRLLLDTPIWIWSLSQPERLSQRVKAALTDAGNELWLSPISVWETALLCAKGRVTIRGSLEALVERARAEQAFREAPLNLEVALEASRLRMPHRDPADYFLAATARVFDLTLVTADETLIAARDIPTLANR
jgi:PIN domain nuclease of toxin-antitoxin system